MTPDIELCAAARAILLPAAEAVGWLGSTRSTSLEQRLATELREAQERLMAAVLAAEDARMAASWSR